MKQFILRVFVALFVLCGILTVVQASTPVDAYFANPSSHSSQAIQKPVSVNPPYGTQVQSHPVTPTQMRTGYTRQEIRSMPMLARPSRPGHFIGNTVRRRAGVGY